MSKKLIQIVTPLNVQAVYKNSQGLLGMVRADVLALYDDGSMAYMSADIIGTFYTCNTASGYMGIVHGDASQWTQAKLKSLFPN